MRVCCGCYVWLCGRSECQARDFLLAMPLKGIWTGAPRFSLGWMTTTLQAAMPDVNCTTRVAAIGGSQAKKLATSFTEIVTAHRTSDQK